MKKKDNGNVTYIDFIKHIIHEQTLNAMQVYNGTLVFIPGRSDGYYSRPFSLLYVYVGRTDGETVQATPVFMPVRSVAVIISLVVFSGIVLSRANSAES